MTLTCSKKKFPKVVHFHSNIFHGWSVFLILLFSVLASFSGIARLQQNLSNSRIKNLWHNSSVQTNRGYKKPNRNRNNQIHYSVWYEGNRIFQNSIPIPFNRIGIPVFWIRFKRKGILNFNRIIRFNRIIQFLTEF